jgi:hypothetical protein
VATLRSILVGGNHFEVIDVIRVSGERNFVHASQIGSRARSQDG